MNLTKVTLAFSLLLTLPGTTVHAKPLTASSVDAAMTGHFTHSTGPLGMAGPLGAFGPLATLGPIGTNAWSVSTVMSTLPDWSKLSQTMALNGGPLSDDGPLGPRGPLAMYDQLGNMSAVGEEMKIGGVLTVLGPLGPLGPLGLLGPLGPLGAHGLKRNKRGEYVNSQSQVQRLITVGSTKKANYELFEVYDSIFAKQIQDNDTSFMVTGLISTLKDVESFAFQSQADQYVTIVAVPEKSLDVFSLTLTNTSGDVVAESASFFLVNWIQTKIKRGENLTAEVRLLASGHVLRKNFRLIVVGSRAAL